MATLCVNNIHGLVLALAGLSPVIHSKSNSIHKELLGSVIAGQECKSRRKGLYAHVAKDCSLQTKGWKHHMRQEFSLLPSTTQASSRLLEVYVRDQAQLISSSQEYGHSIVARSLTCNYLQDPQLQERRLRERLLTFRLL